MWLLPCNIFGRHDEVIAPIMRRVGRELTDRNVSFLVCRHATRSVSPVAQGKARKSLDKLTPHLCCKSAPVHTIDWAEVRHRKTSCTSMSMRSRLCILTFQIFVGTTRSTRERGPFFSSHRHLAGG